MTDDELKGLELTDWPIPDEYLVELGRLAWLWATLEDFLELCISTLAGFQYEDPRPFMLLAHTNAALRLDMLSSLCEAQKGAHPNLANYGQVMTQLRSAQTLRNKFLHNSIAYDADTKTAAMPIVTARGKLKTRVEATTVLDIRRACVEVTNANCALHLLVFQKYYPPAWERRGRASDATPSGSA